MTKTLIDFETRQPFATRFFTQALSGKNLVNAYILRGRDLTQPYKMALRLAQLINCQQSSDVLKACGQCQSCRWIEENAHPGVITVSNATYLQTVDPETGLGKSKTGKPQKSIAVGQLESLLKSLSLHSGGFHRVVILTGVQETLAEFQQGEPCTSPRDWAPENGGTFQPTPLDRRLFPDTLANKFLKVLEEPPLDVIFFLLTDSEDKLLETIVSRCQLVPFVTPAAYNQTELSHPARETFQTLLTGIARQDFLEQVQIFNRYLADGGVDAPEALSVFQQFLQEQMSHNALEKSQYLRLKQYLQSLESAKRWIQDKVREEAVLEDLFIQWAALS